LLQPDKAREVIALNLFLKDFLKPVKQEIIQHNQRLFRKGIHLKGMDNNYMEYIKTFWQA